MGLANRLTEPGEALATAVALAHELARLPQTCMRMDRLSAYEQWDLPFDAAMDNELDARPGLDARAGPGGRPVRRRRGPPRRGPSRRPDGRS